MLYWEENVVQICIEIAVPGSFNESGALQDLQMEAGPPQESETQLWSGQIKHRLKTSAGSSIAELFSLDALVPKILHEQLPPTVFVNVLVGKSDRLFCSLNVLNGESDNFFCFCLWCHFSDTLTFALAGYLWTLAAVKKLWYRAAVQDPENFRAWLPIYHWLYIEPNCPSIIGCIFIIIVIFARTRPAFCL